MDQLKERIQITKWIGNYKYPILVLALGILLMLLPNYFGGTEKTEEEPIRETTVVPESVNSELARILTMVDGAGKVEVMLTVAKGEEILYQTDPKATDYEAGTVINSSTVIVTNESREESGLVRQVIPKTYMGAIVVCQGAEDPSVRLAIVQAVSDVTGLRSDQISVMKMK